ncbi:MAG: hypothetical protein U1E65_30985 [Myxococcota bacterium]
MRSLRCAVGALFLGLFGCTATIAEGPDAGGAADAGVEAHDAGPGMDAAEAAEAGAPDLGSAVDAGPNLDAEPSVDLGSPVDAGSPTDAGSPEDAGRTVGMFVGIGYAGRTTISCDDGQHWVANRSDDENLRCFSSTTTDCDHSSGAGRGVGWSNGWFIASFGWGAPTSLRRSDNGVDWTTVVTYPQASFSSIAAAPGRVMASARTGRISTDDGLSWSSAAEARLSHNGATQYNVRRAGFGAGVFLLVADGPSAAVSADGSAWTLSTIPDACGHDIQWSGGIAAIGSTLVILGSDGVPCTSTDGGQSFSAHPSIGQIPGRLLVSGDGLVAFGNSGAPGYTPQVFRSSDGVDWTAAPTTLVRAGGGAPVAGPPIGPVAVSPSGVFVAANGGWQEWYERQHFYRSTDGVNWQELPAGSFAPSHPMTQMVWGEGRPSAACP